MLSKLANFIRNDIWRIRLRTVSRHKSFLIKQLRIILLALRGFDEDKCRLRASALTFYSLLSIVPVTAMAFGIAKGFGLETLLEDQLRTKFSGHEEVLDRVIGFAHSLLENTKGGAIAGVGVALLFWSVVKVLSNIEHSFDDIWGIEQPRSLGRKFSDYLSMMLICPVSIIISGSLTVFVTTQVIMITDKVALLGLFSSAIFFALKLLPYCMIWALFTFVYIFMPNTRVRFSSALLAGVLTGTTYQILQWTYITFQVEVTRYNAIYGSFAALPLFLMWLQLSWLIVFFGAEFCFAHQNVDTYEFEPDCLRASNSFKRLLALRITHLLVKHFCHGSQAPNATDISHIMQIPIRLARHILHDLVRSGVVSETKTDDPKVSAYQPARSIDVLTVNYVIDALDQTGSANIPVAETDESKVLSQAMQTFAEAVEHCPANVLLKDI